MRITRDMTIAGIPAMKLRETFRWYEGSSWSAASLAESLGVDEPAGLEVVARLLEEGYVEPDGRYDGVTCFKVTLKGGALAIASAGKPIKRATAELLVEGVVRTAEMVNADDSYHFRVNKILAFGSYLTDCPTLGDVDLAVELKPRAEGGDRDTDAILEYANRAQAAGQRFRSYLDKLNWPTEAIHRALKGPSKSISIHSTADPVLEKATTRVLYVSR